MSAELDSTGTSSVYWCIVCGAALRQSTDDEEEGSYLTVHRPVPHPWYLTFDEEDNPQ